MRTIIHMHQDTTNYCGKTYLSNSTYENEDGKIVSETNYPWTVFIQFKIKNSFIQGCFGTLITPFTVITALNCTHIADRNLTKNDLKLTCGRYKTINKVADMTDFQTFSVKSIIREFNYYEEKEDGEVKDNISEDEINNTGKFFNSTVDYFNMSNKLHQLENPVIIKEKKKLANLNIAILTLQTNVGIYLEEVAMPVCIDKTNGFELTPASKLKGIFVDGQVTNKMEFMFHNDCLKFIESGVWENVADHQILMNYEFCGHFPGENGERDSDTGDNSLIAFGTGITSNINGRHFLFGVITRYIPLKSRKTGHYHTLLVITDVRQKNVVSNKTRFSTVLYENIVESDNARLNSSAPKGVCNVPFATGTKFLESRCKANRTCFELQTHAFKNERDIIYIQCLQNYTMKGRIYHKICLNGAWIPKDNKCVRLCGPLPSRPSIKTYCTYEGKEVSCSEKVMAGTISHSICESEGFNKETLSYNNMCLHSGNWRDSPGIIEVLCIDLCGILKLEKPLIQDGKEANNTLHPWNAALYLQDENRDYFHVCGGTLISKYAVLSAAHCAHDKNGERLPASIFKIGLAKYYREFNNPADSDAQFIDVKNLFVPSVYDGAPSSFIYDIMILELKEAAELNTIVVPACIDTSNKFVLTDLSIGSVVGWGYDGTGEDRQQTTTLNEALLPYIDREQCVRDYQSLFQLKITKDKFCAFYLKAGAPTVRGGDSGSGLTFMFKQRHYVYGLVSLQSNNTVSMFTNITYSAHIEFINKVLNTILENNEITNLSQD